MARLKKDLHVCGLRPRKNGQRPGRRVTGVLYARAGQPTELGHHNRVQGCVIPVCSSPVT